MLYNNSYVSKKISMDMYWQFPCKSIKNPAGNLGFWEKPNFSTTFSITWPHILYKKVVARVPNFQTPSRSSKFDLTIKSYAQNTKV